MSGKRIRSVTAKPGELKAVWGTVDRHGSPSICYAWGGAGADKSDGHFLSSVLEGERYAPASFDDIRAGKKMGEYITVKSFAAELEERGYDLTTLKFSVQLKPQPTPEKE